MFRTATIAAAISLAVAGVAHAGDATMSRQIRGPENPMITTPTWEVLRPDITDESAFRDGEDLVFLQAPKAASDAAFVPFSIRQKRGTGERITKMTVVVDENPAPLVANFDFGPLAGDLYLESRVRYDQPSNLRVIAYTDAGNVYMTGRHILAAGGCSAAAAKDPTEAIAHIGEMKLRQFASRGGSASSGQVRQAQLMIRHPNFTGMQRMPDGSIIDPRFVDDVEVRLGDDVLFHMTGGFSISEDPTFRFTYVDNGALDMTVTVRDTSGAVFRQVFPLNTGS